MIPDYKFYHGAVLGELVDVATREICIDELKEEGRLTSYVINGQVGLHIKHSRKRLPPWQFTVTRANLLELIQLGKRYRAVFIALVCYSDGIVVLSIEEVADLLAETKSQQAWLRVDRRRRKWYSVYGKGKLKPIKKSYGMLPLLAALN